MNKEGAHRDIEQQMPENDKQEIWFSALAANDSHTFDSDKAFERFLVQTQSKHHSIKSIQKILFRIAVVILFLVASSLSYWWGEHRLHEHFADILVEASQGSKTKLILPDSTLVWLNAGSKIIYSQGFGVKDRLLQLNGEAYFEVRKNTTLPFKVKTKELNVQVLGTKFNFRNYENEEEVVVNLLEGKVELQNNIKQMKLGNLYPSEKAILNKKTGNVSITHTETGKAKEWIHDILFFDEMLLGDIVKELNRSYNIDIQIADEHLKQYRFYALFNRNEQNILNVLDLLTSTNQLTYKIHDNTILLYHK